MAAFCTACGQPLAPDVKFCSQCGASTTDLSTLAQSVVPQKQPGIRCKTCGVGTLQLVKRYRMSTPVVAIGYIILVPSVLFIIICVMSIFRIASLSNSDSSEMASGILVFFALAAFVGGLLGWLLIMKKKVLICTHCSAVVPAS